MTYFFFSVKLQTFRPVSSKRNHRNIDAGYLSLKILADSTEEAYKAACRLGVRQNYFVNYPQPVTFREAIALEDLAPDTPTKKQPHQWTASKLRKY